MATIDAEGRDRRGVYLPPDLWDWLDETAQRDGSSRSDLLEGLVLLARDRAAVRMPPDSGTLRPARGRPNVVRLRSKP